MEKVIGTIVAIITAMTCLAFCQSNKECDHGHVKILNPEYEKTLTWLVPQTNGNKYQTDTLRIKCHSYSTFAGNSAIICDYIKGKYVKCKYCDKTIFRAYYYKQYINGFIIGFEKSEKPEGYFCGRIIRARQSNTNTNMSNEHNNISNHQKIHTPSIVHNIATRPRIH